MQSFEQNDVTPSAATPPAPAPAVAAASAPATHAPKKKALQLRQRRLSDCSAGCTHGWQAAAAPPL